MNIYIKTKKHCIKWNITKCIKNIGSIFLIEGTFIWLALVGLIRSGFLEI